MPDNGLIFWEKLIDKLAEEGRPMAEKYIKFALDEIEFAEETYGCNTEQERKFRLLNFTKSGNGRYITSEEAKRFIQNLKEMSVDLTYEDVKTVCTEYAPVLRRSRKRGMRGQRNFTGKIEDEIKGKLAELGTAKFCYEVSKVRFEPDFSVLEDGALRDEGDFVHVVHKRSKIQLPTELIIAIKSTAGYFSFGVPENEWTWPGGVYISVRLHIDESFLLRLINKSLGLEDFELTKKIGWLEISGYVLKTELEGRAFIGRRLPGKYHSLAEDWRLPNYIMHPLQLHRTLEEFKQLMRRYTEFMNNNQN